MRNGYQWPDDKADGDTKGKNKVNKKLFLDKVGQWFGARLSFTPLNYKTNKISIGGAKEASLDIGNRNWLQFFVSGSILKNVSIFIEQEFDSDHSHNSWFRLNFTNLAGTLVNFQVGSLSPTDFTPLSDRLRMWQKSNVLNIKSSNGLGENSVNIRSPRPGFQYYGYKGPAIWFAGIDNGKDASDVDHQKNYWAGFRLEVPHTSKSSFMGSSVGVHYYAGTDAVNSTAPERVENDFTRLTLAANVRYNDNFDFQFAYQVGNDDNVALTDVPVKGKFTGYTFSGSYLAYPFYVILQFDQVSSSNITGLDTKIFSPSFWFFLRENWKCGCTIRLDMSDSTLKRNEFALQIRSMF